MIGNKGAAMEDIDKKFKAARPESESNLQQVIQTTDESEVRQHLSSIVRAQDARSNNCSVPTRLI
jgi:hypothetical protein